jgi:hypothetical protein
MHVPPAAADGLKKGTGSFESLEYPARKAGRAVDNPLT